MTRKLFYIIGAPGAGKSTLMKALTEGMPRLPTRQPVPHIIYGDGQAAEIGWHRETFSGTDALAMSIQPAAEEWIAQRPYRTLLAEGDRLANGKFFRAATAAGYELYLIYLSGSSAPAARREQRAAALGRPPQNATWVKGRESKAAALARDFAAYWVPSELPVDAWLRMLEESGYHPFKEAVLA